MNIFLEELLEKIHSLEAKISSLEEANSNLKKENTKLRERIVYLEERLNLNSKNSSKPPSSDQKGSSEPRRKGGAKSGHAGHSRVLFPKEQVDRFIKVKAKTCPTCGNKVVLTNKQPSIHQQVEIAAKPFTVTQYNREHFYCPCCRTYGSAPLPAEVGSSAFGTRLSALMGFLTGTCRLSRRMTLEVLKESFGIQVAVGSQSNVEKRISSSLKAPYQEIYKQICDSKETRYVDETGWHCCGKREFVWLMSTRLAAIYKIQNGRKAIYRDAFLKKAIFKKVSFVTDRLAIYHFPGPHQYCLAHIKRNLKKFAKRSGLDGEWAKVMLFYLKRIFALWRDFRERRRSRRSFRHSIRRYRDDFEYGLLVAVTKQKHSPSLKNFALNLLKKAKNLWVFAEKDEVEPTNNQAERDLRGIVIWRKISYGSKSERGSRFAERIQSIVMTLKRQKRLSLDYLTESLRAWKVGSTAPSIFTLNC